MDNHTCQYCQKTFQSAEALNMHTAAKHPETIKKPKVWLLPKKKKKIRNWLIFIVIISIIIVLWHYNSNKSTYENIPINVPKGDTHWHPKITIKINGQITPIQKNIGINVGRIVDTNLAGMRMSPIHTHETDGTIHLENKNPSKKPETLTLGYFFYVWGKQFNRDCIFDYCSNKGILKMYVNGKENPEFENYFMHDKDDIVIEYKSNYTN